MIEADLTRGIYHVEDCADKIRRASAGCVRRFRIDGAVIGENNAFSCRDGRTNRAIRMRWADDLRDFAGMIVDRDLSTDRLGEVRAMDMDWKTGARLRNGSSGKGDTAYFRFRDVIFDERQNRRNLLADCHKEAGD